MKLPTPFTRDPRPERATAQVRLHIGFASDRFAELLADFDRVHALYPGATRAEVARRVWLAGVASLLGNVNPSDDRKVKP